MKKKTLVKSGIVIAVSMLITASLQANTIVYRQTFGTNKQDPSWAQHAYWDTDWTPRRGSNGTVPVIYLNSYDGRPTDLAPINADTPSPEVLDQGFTNFNIGADTHGYTYTTETIDIAREDVNKGVEITWYQLSEVADLQTHLLVEMNGDWYVSDTTFASDSSGGLSTFATRANQVGTMLSDTEWSDFTFPSASDPAAINASTTLPETGDLTSFGVYMPQTGGFRLMYDTFEVTVVVVPEPATLMLFGVGLFGLAFYRRRHR